MTNSVIPRLAATLLLLRDSAEGIEVLMTVRHEKSGFAAGALVFPGGKVDAEDATLGRYCANAGDADLPALGFRIAAIRETFEECGVLLARRKGMLLGRAEVAGLQKHHDEAGTPLGFGKLLAENGLELATDTLVHYAHWITPVDRPKRFDTHFFLAPAPSGQEPLHDGREIVEAVWTTPSAALRGAVEGRFKLVFATHMNLAKLGSCSTVADALDRARREAVVTITPEVVRTEAGTIFRIPESAGYGVTEVAADKLVRP